MSDKIKIKAMVQFKTNWMEFHHGYLFVYFFSSGVAITEKVVVCIDFFLLDAEGFCHNFYETVSNLVRIFFRSPHALDCWPLCCAHCNAIPLMEHGILWFHVKPQFCFPSSISLGLARFFFAADRSEISSPKWSCIVLFWCISFECLTHVHNVHAENAMSLLSEVKANQSIYTRIDCIPTSSILIVRVQGFSCFTANVDSI